MRKIIFYHFENGRCPIDDFLESLDNKQVEKVFFVLDMIETIDIVPRKFLKNLNQPIIFGKFESSMGITFFGCWVFSMAMTCLF